MLMPTRKRSRFGDLERQLRDLNGGDPPVGSVLDKYLKYKKGETKLERRTTNKLTAAQRKRVGYSVSGFNTDFAASPAAHAKRQIVSITTFSNTARTALGISNANAGYAAQTVDDVSADSDPSFFPALIKPSLPAADGKEGTNSAITGREYTYVESRNYSIPFGRRAADDSEEERRAALSADARSSATPPRSIGYEPEVYRGQRSALPEGA